MREIHLLYLQKLDVLLPSFLSAATAGVLSLFKRRRRGRHGLLCGRAYDPQRAVRSFT